MKTDLKITSVRYFETRRGVGYECKTNKKNVVVWNDGNGGETWIPPHHPFTSDYVKLRGYQLESLIDDYENKIYNYEVTVYHGGEQPSETFKVKTLYDAKELAMKGEHAEIIDLKTNKLVE